MTLNNNWFVRKTLNWQSWLSTFFTMHLSTLTLEKQKIIRNYQNILYWYVLILSILEIDKLDDLYYFDRMSCSHCLTIHLFVCLCALSVTSSVWINFFLRLNYYQCEFIYFFKQMPKFAHVMNVKVPSMLLQQLKLYHLVAVSWRLEDKLSNPMFTWPVHAI